MPNLYQLYQYVILKLIFLLKMSSFIEFNFPALFIQPKQNSKITNYAQITYLFFALRQAVLPTFTNCKCPGSFEPTLVSFFSFVAKRPHVYNSLWTDR